MLHVDVVEGFDMVGKTTYIHDILMKQYKEKGYQCMYYHPDYDFYNQVDPSRDSMYLVGYGIFDFIESNLDTLKSLNLSIIIDRGVLSSIVYSDNMSDEFKNVLLQSYNKLQSIKNYTTLHYVSTTKDNAEHLYHKSQLRSDNELLDRYENFESYYNKYLKYHNKYCRLLTSINYKDICLVDNQISKFARKW